jgi:hypothetical protein
MKKILVSAIASLLVTMATAAVQAEPSTQLVSSHAEVAALLRSAHSTTQYHVLAIYFHQQQTALDLEAQAEKAEWQSRSRNSAGMAAKYPRPADSSRFRYEYLKSKAETAARHAAHFEELAAAQ